ncbi:hypothetical protein AgCh_029881 [Apium graveolens]
MLAAVVRRPRDSDSAVRLACVTAVTSMASQITKPSFSTLSKPLIDAILHEHDLNLQTGSALCLAAAIDAAPDPEPVQLQKLLPKLLKLNVKQFAQEKPVNLRPGINHISLLCMTLGIQNSGAHMEKRWTGPDMLVIKGLNTGTLDLTQNNFGHEAYFDIPQGDDPFAITMDSMQKGHCWINGNSIGHYWTSFITPLGKPSQSEYHIPRATSPSVHSYERKSNQLRLLDDGLKEGAQLHCPAGKVVEKVEFASFGDPIGACGLYSLGNCHSPISQQVIEQDEQQLDNVDSYFNKSADSKHRFSDGSTYPWDALPINELDDKDEQLLDDLDIPLKFCNIEHGRVSFFAFNMGELPLLP